MWERQPAYDPARLMQEPLVIWDRNEFFGRHALPDPATFKALAENGEAPVLITGGPFTPEQSVQLNVHLLAPFPDAINALIGTTCIARLLQGGRTATQTELSRGGGLPVQSARNRDRGPEER